MSKRLEEKLGEALNDAFSDLDNSLEEKDRMINDLEKKAERYERALKEIEREGTFGTDIVTKEVYRHSGAQIAYEVLEGESK